MKKLLLRFVKNWEEFIAAIALSIMLLTAVFNVFTRYILQSPFTWAEELECICLVWSTFCGAAAAYKHNLHYGMDFLVDHLPIKAKVVLRRFITFVCIFLFAYLTVLAVQFVMAATKTTSFFRLSYKFIDFSAVMAFASMTVYSVIYFVESFVKPEKYVARYAAAYEDEIDEEENQEGGADE